MLEFAQEQDFAVHGFELLDGAADPQAGLGGIPLRGIGRRVSLAEERGAEGGFAAMGAKNLETNRVEIGAEEGARFVAGGGTQQRNESLLRQFLGLRGLEDAAPEKTVDGLLVAREKLRKRLRRALRKGQHEPFIADASGRSRG